MGLYRLPYVHCADTLDRVEKIASTAIGILLIILALAAIGTSIASLVAHEEPSGSDATLIIAGSTIFITFLLWVPKRYLAHALDSTTMQGEALCALSCIQFSVVLLIGSLVYRFWRNGWWLDSATAIVIALLFGWEGIKMVRFAQSKHFNGGCCGGHGSKKETEPSTVVSLSKTQSCANSCSSSESCQCSVKEVIPAAEQV